MSKSPKVFQQGLKQLSLWFERQKRVLPWRSRPTLYRVWISEIMLQQTQVATVIPYFKRFLGHFPTVQSLAMAPEEEVLKYWAGLGYYSRARNLHRAAHRIVEEGDFPRTLEGWLELPGVGRYTAGAILSIALDQPMAILDGNVERVLSRLRRVGREQGDGVYKARLWRLSWIFVQRGFGHGVRPSVLNQALMELGATVCLPRVPQCERCPVQLLCRAYEKADVSKYPPPRERAKQVQLQEEVHCVADGRGRVLLRKKEKGEWHAGLWDFLKEAPTGLKQVGSIRSRYVVTNHAITRVTWLWRVQNEKGIKKIHSKKQDGEFRWVPLASPYALIGAPVKKIWSEMGQSLFRSS